jgi:aspartate-semialdehyde dehydrogenase
MKNERGEKPRVVLVGTDTMRGNELKNILSKKSFPLEDIDFFDPDVEEEYSKLTQFRGEPKVIKPLDKDSIQGADLVFLAADKKVNQEFGRLAGKQKIIAIDLSETFNADEKIPVVVSGVNDEIVAMEKPALIANPHPVTVILSHLFHAVLGEFGLLKAISFILQPVSAFEKSGIDELADQSYALLSSSKLSKKVFNEQIAFNILSHTEKADRNGFSSVEKQITSEIRRVLSSHDFPLSLSVIQAPVFHTYSIMTYLELERKADIQDLKDIFRKCSFFKFSAPALTSPISVSGEEKICIGQIKKELSLPGSFWIWAVADNLTRGSALNAFEIAKKLFPNPPA